MVVASSLSDVARCFTPFLIPIGAFGYVEKNIFKQFSMIRLR
jgi:hypothetical protein